MNETDNSHEEEDIQALDRSLTYYSRVASSLSSTSTSTSTFDTSVADVMERCLPRRMEVTRRIETFARMVCRMSDKYELRGRMVRIKSTVRKQQQQQEESMVIDEAVVSKKCQELREMLLFTEKKSHRISIDGDEKGQGTAGSKRRRPLVDSVTLMNDKIDVVGKGQLSLEERVRVKAKKREQRIKDHLMGKDGCKNAQDSLNHLLPLADALRSFFRSKSHVGKQRSSATLLSLCRSLKGTSFGSKTGGKKASINQMKNHLILLSETFPKWVRIENSNGGMWKKGDSMKGAVLYIDNKNVNYVNDVRVKLGGRQRQNLQRKDEQSQSHKVQRVDRENKSDGKSATLSTVSILKVSENVDSERKVRNTTRSIKWPSSNKAKRVCIMEDLEKEGRESKFKSLNENGSSRRKMSTKRVSRLKRKRKSYHDPAAMRINHELVFGHAFGGEPMQGDPDYVTKKKTSEIGDSRSPNGLKRLFSEMNSGRRI